MYRKQPLRVKMFDYRTAGYYFVTVCTANRICCLGDCLEDRIILSPLGKIVQDCWEKIGQHNAHVQVDQFVVMPNHVHGILVFNDREISQTTRRCSVNSLSGSLASVIGSFKSASTRLGRDMLNPELSLWQARYYEHVIRTEKALGKIRNYVSNNPVYWYLDELNPNHRNIQRQLSARSQGAAVPRRYR
jgi:putative transposase